MQDQGRRDGSWNLQTFEINCMIELKWCCKEVGTPSDLRPICFNQRWSYWFRLWGDYYFDDWGCHRWFMKLCRADVTSERITKKVKRYPRNFDKVDEKLLEGRRKKIKCGNSSTSNFRCEEVIASIPILEPSKIVGESKKKLKKLYWRRNFNNNPNEARGIGCFKSPKRRGWPPVNKR